jgi:hypothetical protein
MVQSTSHLCLEAHKHKGTTFQGTQISTAKAEKLRKEVKVKEERKNEKKKDKHKL